jgi:4-amino-4-deoxy-L-arabinose transferase-like glycosyltransferase
LTTPGRIAFGLILLLGLALRLDHIGNPVLDHPSWRQGDSAEIARNFATREYDILRPQLQYDGPPPHYVELELQIVPFIAATLYKIVGVHAAIGRLVTVAFSLATIGVLVSFGMRLFGSQRAGLFAGLLYAIMPGSVYYGRTFMPDAAMVFFMTAALAAAFHLFDGREWSARRVATATALLALAILAKPVACIAIPIILALAVVHRRSMNVRACAALACLIGVPLLLFFGYDAIVAARAQWPWATDLLTRDVLPSMRASLQDAATRNAKFADFALTMGMLRRTVVGPAISIIAVAGLLFLPRSTQTRTLLFTWLITGLVYAFVVVTVVRVDYYLALLLPLAALLGAAFLAYVATAVTSSTWPLPAKAVVALAATLVLVAIVEQNRAIVGPYYQFDAARYDNARALDRALAPEALAVVLTPYDPATLYVMNRFAWQREARAWTPADELRAIAQGARYLIVTDERGFRANAPLANWMRRFPLVATPATWPVYLTASRCGARQSDSTSSRQTTVGRSPLQFRVTRWSPAECR